MRLILATTMLIGLAPIATSQDVYPMHFVAAGGDNHKGPLGTTNLPARTLLIYDDLQGTPRTINGIAFRPSGRWLQGYPSNNLIVNVALSTSPRTAANPDGEFAKNHGADKKNVASFALLQWPAHTVTSYVEPFV